jgi:hypothetical protein
MKRSIIVSSVLSLLALSPVVALAEPSELEIHVSCPQVDVLANHGDYIAGYGEETIVSMPTKKIYFKSTNVLDANTPKNLKSYFSEKVEYDSTSGQVSCTYTDYRNRYPNVTVSYTLTNAKGGIAEAQASDRIKIRLPLGLRA